jgi:RNA polymerase sigma factor (sigma-70 family)
MEVSALKYSGGIGLHGRTSLLRLQSDDRLIGLLRRGNTAAFEVLVGRYESRLMAFCRHLLGSREDAEDVLQEVMTAAFNAILADDRPINVRPWLYRIARNRSLNHLRRMQAIGVDSMDHHLSEHGASTADKVHEREEFRLLVGDIHELPETQKTALVLREMDALSYEQIAEAMETTVPSVKSLLVRARVSLAEAAEARLLSCNEVRIELAEIAEGLQRRPSPLVRRHLRSCKRCTAFRSQLKQTNKALAALLPVGPIAMFHKLLFLHLGHGAGAASTSTATAAGSGAAGAAGVSAGAAGVGAVGTTALAGGGAMAGSSGLISASIGAFAGKAAAGLAAAALVTAGAVEANHAVHHITHHVAVMAQAPSATATVTHEVQVAPVSHSYAEPRSSVRDRPAAKAAKPVRRPAAKHAATDAKPSTTETTTAPVTTTPLAAKNPVTGRSQTQTDPTVLPPPVAATPPPPVTQSPSSTTSTPPAATTDPGSTPPTSTTPTSTTPTTTTTTTTTPTTSPTTTTPTATTPTSTTTTTPTTTTTTTTSTNTVPTNAVGVAPESANTAALAVASRAGYVARLARLALGRPVRTLSHR